MHMPVLAHMIADYYGYYSQKEKTVEELIELSDTLLHYDYGGRCSREEVIEEMADVQIMLWQMKHLMGCEKEMKDMIMRKLLRQLRRIREEDQ
ncbi:MAG TPA: hypothetical protein H9782_11375 [Candidatus Bariatricus faecipullorum]|nr:hypothetical protein [Candidatus Bariatricus faecipullorum]